MRIKKINGNSYTLKLNKTFYNAKKQYSTTEGFLVELITNSKIGYGEASPLKGFSRETIQEIQWTFQAFIESINPNIEYELNEILMLAEVHCSEIPSLHFAIDTAAYDIASKESKLPLSKLLNPKCSNKVKLSSIYLHEIMIKEYTGDTIKYKLGVQTLNEDIKKLNSIQICNKSIQFRLDCNRCYTVQEFSSMYQRLEHLNINYFEEPIKNPTTKRLHKIKNKHNIKIAIDESLYDGSNYTSWLKIGLIDFVIIKPSILGGYKKNFHLCGVCQKHNINIILSSSLESNIGNMATIHLAAAINNNHEHGLNIHNFYDNFINKSVYKKNASIINLDKLIGLGI